MNPSRNIKSRGRIRRERQLRKQRERIKSRGENRYVPREFTFGAFLRRQGGMVALAVIVIGGIWGVKMLVPDEPAATDIEELIGARLEAKRGAWAKEYPNGYKLVALTGEEIIPTSHDTFSSDFKIDWKKLSVTRIKADHLKSTEEKIRITAPQVHYLPRNTSSQSMVTATISRKAGMKAALAKFDRFEFIVEIIEDKEGYLFCLFGLKDT